MKAKVEITDILRSQSDFDFASLYRISLDGNTPRPCGAPSAWASRRDWLSRGEFSKYAPTILWALTSTKSQLFIHFVFLRYKSNIFLRSFVKVSPLWGESAIAGGGLPLMRLAFLNLFTRITSAVNRYSCIFECNKFSTSSKSIVLYFAALY